MGSNSFEMFLRTVLLFLLPKLPWLQSRDVFLGSDQFIFFDEHDSSRRVAPDLYALLGKWSHQQLPSIKTWIHGAPIWALEIASTDGRKDYLRAPQVYEDVGVQELVVYDPNWRQRKEGARWQVWRQTNRGFVQVLSNCAKQVYCEQLDAWLVEVVDQGVLQLRPGVGPQGEKLVKLDAEEAQQERQARELAEQREQQERLAREEAEIQGQRALEPLVHLYERKLKRALTDQERSTLRARLGTHGPAKLGDVVLDMTGDELGAWLADPNAT
jgi:Uma2 family endonuclease